MSSIDAEMRTMNSQQSHQTKPIQPTMPELEIPGLKLMREIGRGGMARVYLAQQESLLRPVAVKILNNLDTPGFHERFMNEGRYLGALSHSNIVDIYDVGESNGYYHITMEYLPGGDLTRRIRKGIKPGTALKLAARIASCLDYLHGQGMVHRDLKPANILFRGDNNPIITDFGIAKLLENSLELTSNSSVMGSPYYLSPEQAVSSSNIDGRSDLYSLGVILFEMLSGRRPFTGENYAAIIMAQIEQPIPQLPRQLLQYQPIIDRLLAKKPDTRFQNGGELIQAIRGEASNDAQYLHATSERESNAVFPKQVAGKSGPIPKGRSWLKISLVAVFLLATVGLMWLLTWDHKPELNTSRSALKTTEVVAESKPQLLLAKEIPVTPKVEPNKATPVKPRLSKSDQLLKLANKRMDALRLSTPKGDNALKYFREVLKLEPDNRDAQAGIRQIVLWYTQQAERALLEEKLEKGKLFIGRGLAIDSNHAELLALQKKITPPKPKPKQQLQKPPPKVEVRQKVFDPLEIFEY